MYIGGKQFSLRSRASNFTLDDIAELVRFANAHQAKVHVTVNLLPHDEDLDGLSDYLQALDKAGVHAIIVASPAIMKRAKALGCHYEIHVSTQHSSTNSAAVRFWKGQGVDRVVLGRECTLDEVEAICEKNILPIEVFIHGRDVHLVFGTLRFKQPYDFARRQPGRLRAKLPLEVPFDGARRGNLGSIRFVFHVFQRLAGGSIRRKAHPMRCQFAENRGAHEIGVLFGDGRFQLSAAH